MTGSRRQFLINSSAAAAGLGLATPREAAAGRKAVVARDRIRFGVIGVKGMGWADMRSALKIDGVECVALCDVDQRELDRRKKDVLEAQEQEPKLYGTPPASTAATTVAPRGSPSSRTTVRWSSTAAAGS